MRLHHFIGNFDLSAASLIVDDAELALQITKVLRLKSGDRVILCDGRGYESRAEIRSVRPASISFQLEKKEKVEREPSRALSLYCSILKRENFELVVQKAVEVGAMAIVPLICERTVKQELKAERIAKIVKEAAEQSGRGVVPVVKPPMRFDDGLHDSEKYEQRFLCEPDSKHMLEPAKDSASIALFIGPEGGWSESEIERAKDSDITAVTLGALTLRAETAAIIASFLALR